MGKRIQSGVLRVGIGKWERIFCSDKFARGGEAEKWPF